VLSLKIPEFCTVGGVRSKTAFFAFYRTPRLSCAQPAWNISPNSPQINGTDGKPSLLLIWRVCGQAFRRYRPLKSTEKWSHDHHENWKFAYSPHVEKFTDSKKCYSFRSTMSGVTRHLWTLGSLELTLVVNTCF